MNLDDQLLKRTIKEEMVEPNYSLQFPLQSPIQQVLQDTQSFESVIEFEVEQWTLQNRTFKDIAKITQVISHLPSAEVTTDSHNLDEIIWSISDSWWQEEEEKLDNLLELYRPELAKCDRTEIVRYIAADNACVSHSQVATNCADTVWP